MKQSLRSFLPNITAVDSASKLPNDSIFVVFDQNADLSFEDFIKSEILTNSEKKFNFVFGPEGGFSEKELKLFSDAVKVKLSSNRLRAETAVITAAAILNSKVE